MSDSRTRALKWLFVFVRACVCVCTCANYPFLFTFSLSYFFSCVLYSSLLFMSFSLCLDYRNAGFHGSMMNHPGDDMFMLSSQVEYNSSNNSNNHSGHSNRHSIGGLVGGYNSNASSNGPYSVYQQHQDKPSHAGPNNRMYFSDELLDDGGGKQDHDSSLYGKLLTTEFMQNSWLFICTCVLLCRTQINVTWYPFISYIF